MREILFRGKDTTFRIWQPGDLVHINGVMYINVDKLLVKVIPDTIGQFIGITDKNGMRVFEGDIIRAIAEGEENIYAIEWCGNNRYPAFDIKPQPDCDSNGLSYLLWVGAEIEVIGNIYDNPELLEGKAK